MVRNSPAALVGRLVAWTEHDGGTWVEAAAPIAAQWLGDRGGTSVVGLYLALAGVVSWFGLLMVRKITPA